MTVIRTQRIAVGSLDLAVDVERSESPVWTCPAGVTVIVRHIDAGASFLVTTGNEVNGAGFAMIEPGGAGPFLFARMDWNGQLGGPEQFAVAVAQWTGTAVFYPGDRLWLGADRPAVMSYQVSGAILPAL